MSKDRFEKSVPVALNAINYATVRLKPSVSSFITLYSILIIILYGIFVMSVFILIFGYTIKLIKTFEISNIIYLHIKPILLFLNNKFINYINNIIAEYELANKGEIIGRSDVLALMATTLSIVVGFYGVVSQLYTGEWGGWIMLRRPLILIRSSRHECFAISNGLLSEASNKRIARKILSFLFPLKVKLRVITFEFTLVLLLALAFLHFISMILLGSSYLVPLSLELVIYILILVATVIVVWLTTMIRPPLSVWTALIASEGGVSLGVRGSCCISIPMGIFTLLRPGRSRHRSLILLAVLSVGFILASILLYVANPVEGCIPFEGSSCVGVPLTTTKIIIIISLYFFTAMSMGLLLGLVNCKFLHTVSSGLTNLIKIFISKNIKYKFIIFGAMLGICSFALSANRPISDLTCSYIIAILLSGVLAYQLTRSRDNVISFSMQVSYADKVLELASQQAKGGASGSPYVLDELLVSESILLLMTSVASWKTPVILGSPYRRTTISVELDDRILEEYSVKHGAIARYFLPIIDIEKYLIHVESLAKFALDKINDRVHSDLLALTVVAAANSILNLEVAGRIRPQIYARALQSILRFLLHIHLMGYGLRSYTLQLVEQTLPDVLASFHMFSSKLPREACVFDENIKGYLEHCIKPSHSTQKEYCCVIVRSAMSNCLEYSHDATLIKELEESCMDIGARKLYR